MTTNEERPSIQLRNALKDVKLKDQNINNNEELDREVEELMRECANELPWDFWNRLNNKLKSQQQRIKELETQLTLLRTDK